MPAMPQVVQGPPGTGKTSPSAAIFVLCCYVALHRYRLPLTTLWKIIMFNGKIHYKSPFSIAMLNYQMVIIDNTKKNTTAYILREI
jgi:hypothetical protein